MFSQFYEITSSVKRALPLIMSDDIKVVDFGGLRSDTPATSAITNAGVALTTQNTLSTQKVKAFLSTNTFPEKQISIPELLSRPVTLGYDNIPTTYGINTLLADYAFPSALFDASASVQKFGAVYSFIKWKKIHIVVTMLGSLDTAGGAIGAPCWVTGLSLVDSYIGTMASREHMQIMDFSDVSQNYHFEIPWRYPDEAMYIGVSNAKLQMFDFKIVLLAPVNITSRIVTTAWFEGCEMSVTRPGIMGSKMSTIYNTYGTVEGSVNPNTRVGDDIDLANDMKFGGFHSPTDALNPLKVEPIRNSYTMSADNIRFIERLAIHPGVDSHVKLADFGTDVDEMSFDYLKSKWTYVSNYRYNTTTTLFLEDANTSKSVWSVGPNMGVSLSGGDQTASHFRIGPLDMISTNHKYWSGDIENGCFEFMIKILSTRKQTGRLWFGFLPAVFRLDTLTYAQLTDTFGEHIDVGGPVNEFIVRIPFLSPTARKYIYQGLWDAGTIASPRDIDTQQFLSCFAGRAYLIAESPLITPDGAPTSVDIAVFYRGAPGYQVFGPNSSTNWVTSFLSANAKPALVMAGAITLSTDSGHIVQQDMPPTLSVRDVCRSYHLKAKGGDITNNDTFSTVSVDAMVSAFNYNFSPNPMSPKNMYTTPIDEFMLMYAGFKGSLRYRLGATMTITQTQGHATTQTLYSAPLIARAYLINNYDGFMNALAVGKLSTFSNTLHNSILQIDSSSADYKVGAPMGFKPIAESRSIDGSVVLEYEIPFNSVHKWLDFSICDEFPITYAVVNALVPGEFQNGSYSASIQISVAFGDDARFGVYDGCHFRISRPTDTGSLSPVFIPAPAS